MLDGFHQHHSQLVYRNRKCLRVNEEGFKAARRAAAKSLDPPDRVFFRGGGELDRHRLFYEFYVAREMGGFTSDDLPSKVDRTLVEVVLLQSFLRMEEASQLRDSYSISRSVAVLGWMIQERFQYIILQTRNQSLQELMDFRGAYGIDPYIWESRLVGATAQAKAMMQISEARSLRLYPSSLMNDVKLGIDFFIETLDGAGACVSVKTHVDGRSRFLLESETGYEQTWKRIELGSQSFREYASRNWRPLLLLMGKFRGEVFNLRQKPGRVARWVTLLEHTLNGTQPDDDSLTLTT